MNEETVETMNNTTTNDTFAQNEFNNDETLDKAIEVEREIRNAVETDTKDFEPGDIVCKGTIRNIEINRHILNIYYEAPDNTRWSYAIHVEREISRLIPILEYTDTPESSVTELIGKQIPLYRRKDEWHLHIPVGSERIYNLKRRLVKSKLFTLRNSGSALGMKMKYLSPVLLIFTIFSLFLFGINTLPFLGIAMIMITALLNSIPFSHTSVFSVSEVEEDEFVDSH